MTLFLMYLSVALFIGALLWRQRKYPIYWDAPEEGMILPTPRYVTYFELQALCLAWPLTVPVFVIYAFIDYLENRV